MRVAMVLLLLASARGDEMHRLDVGRDVRIRELVRLLAKEVGWVLLHDPEDAATNARLDHRLGHGIRGSGLRGRIPRNKLKDTCVAILGFHEVPVRDLAPGVSVVASNRAGARGRYPVALLGEGAATQLTLAYPAGALAHEEVRDRALLPESRERLLGTLRGVHAGGRALAARLLGVLGPHDDAIVRELRQARQDPDAAVRAAAQRALARIPLRR